MIRNSIGNVTEIIRLLDADKYSGEEVLENYKFLVDKWGEWELVGLEGSGIAIKYIDIGNALFSGLMVTFCVFMSISFTASIVLGKIVFPLLTKHYKNNNEEMVDLATLQSASQINEMHSKKKRGEWF